MSSWVLAIWGRGVLQRRVTRLEQLMERWRRLYALQKRSNDELLAENRRCGKLIGDLEAQNAELIKVLEQFREAERVIDPNAKCPGCGHCKGHLTSLYQGDEFRVVNNCEVCGMTFISAPPVAGEQRAADLYQSMQVLPPARKGA